MASNGKEGTVDPINRTALAQVREQWTAELARMRTLSCESVEAEAWWGDVILSAQAELKDIESDRTLITKPINEDLRRINTEFKGYAAPLEAVKLLAKDKIKAFMRLQAKLERASLLAAEAAAKAGDGEACALALEAIPEASKPRGAQKAWRWAIKIVDMKLVSREYLKVDLDALLALCDNKSDVAPAVCGVVFERVPVVAAGRK